MSGLVLTRRPFALLLVASLVAALLVGAVPASADVGSDAPAAAAAKLPGVLGVATVAGKPVVHARVRVFARGHASRASKRGGKRPWYGHNLRLAKAVRTNKHGGFTSAVRGLPRQYLVKVSGGKVGRRPFRKTLYALAQSNERGVVVNPVTTVAAAFSRQHPRTGTRKSTRRIGRLLGIPALTGGTMALGQATGVESTAFSPRRFMAAANRRRGGLPRFAKRLARLAAHPRARRSYVNKLRRPVSQPGYPRTSKPRKPRKKGKSAGAPVAGASSSLASSILGGVLKTAIYSASCSLAGPSLPSNMLCGGGGDAAGVAQQIDDLETSVVDIQNTLDAMQVQLQAIEDDEVEQAYSDAYDFAGVDPVNTLVQSASSDLNLLNASNPSPSSGFEPEPSATSISAQCAAVYPNLYTNNSDPYDVCVDFLTQATTFAASPTDYFSTLYESLTGAGNQPQDNLLAYTYQQVLTGGGDTPVPQSSLADVQNNIGQVVQLQANAFAILANAQTFQYMVTTGDQPSCPDTTVSGTFPADTPIDVADVCAVAETSLFEAAVETDVAGSVDVPPAGAVADPRTNYIWWGYPVDLSNATTSSGSYPFYPGAASGTYSISGGLIAVASATTPQSILAADPSYKFLFADSTQAQTIFKNLAAPSGGSLDTALADLGFVGLGGSAYGLSWDNLGVAVNANGYSTTSEWNSSTHEAYMTCAQGSYPNISGQFQCTSVEVTDGGYYGDPVPGVTVKAPLATSFYSLTSTSVGSSPSGCGSIAYSTSGVTGTPSISTSSGSWVHYCTADTYGLLVDTQAPAPGAAANGVVPPFWTTAMLVGPPSGGVPAIAVPAPS